MPLLTTIGASAARGFGFTVGGPVQGQQAYYGYDGTGDFTWVAPAGVTSVCVVCVGQPGKSIQWQYGGGGGGLGYKNNISVTPGSSYNVRIPTTSETGYPTTSGRAYFDAATTVAGNGGGNYQRSGAGGTYVGDGGGNGGDGGTPGGSCPSVSHGGSGGGAAGYSGNGGDAGDYSGAGTAAGSAGSGGGGGGGRETQIYPNSGTWAGGGVGVMGEGSSGAGGTTSNGGHGFGGSGGANGTGSNKIGGASGYGDAYRGYGAVRIIWGEGRSFPSTNTADV